MLDDTQQEILQLTQELLDCIAAGDWDTYSRLCDESLTCFEPEAVGNLIHGLDFHKYYLDLARQSDGPIQTTIAAPHIRCCDSIAIISYVRVIQKGSPPITQAFEETRVWQATDGGWKHIHFHRSAARYWDSQKID